MKDMLGRHAVKEAQEALRLLLDAMPQKELKEESLEIEESLQRVCSREIMSADDLPAFARSTVDGYAVKAQDTFGATETMPAYLNLTREIHMGEKADFTLKKGDASKIPTGGMLPHDADATVMFENVQVIDEKTIEVLRQVAPGENVIQKGEDVRKGELVIKKGHRIRPQDIAAMAGIGVREIIGYRKPRVAIISTGDEIVPASSEPNMGQVRDTNSYLLAGLVSKEECIPLRKGIFKDEYNILRDVIEESMGTADAIIISGGTSVGTKDMISNIINDIGSPGVVFHGVALKPGKPMIGGVIKGKPVFGMPGHPAAVGICFDIFVSPVLERLSGLEVGSTKKMAGVVRARLSKNVSSSPGREEHIRVIIEEREDGLWAVPVLGKSGLITTLVKADGIFVIPLHVNGIQQGEFVDVRLF